MVICSPYNMLVFTQNFRAWSATMMDAIMRIMVLLFTIKFLCAKDSEIVNCQW